ncbi:peroxiredoxin-like family protein [Jannaschia rubra]|uniref:AhpC/TSA family protein n=1 Tax=Jannaschia rubra TaxID=282197 RepID=A0A0M6XKY4_9RHOB|nr:peroxiredoxin-like family protein [Jannaschia rubra]CTQ31332.1 AhpC/TSA family protein [Jannaschia rubra]SFF81489.1 Peroxiredoxin [Jannaschia rubra]
MTETVSMPLPGRPAPALDLDLIIGAKWSLAEQSPEAFTMIVAYRGLHCPICKEYLTDLRDLYDDFLAKGVEVVTVSMDDADRAKAAHGDWGLDPMPMAHDMTEDQARAWGLFLSEGQGDDAPEVFSEPGLFLVKPDGTLYLAEMASGPFVRPDLKLLASKMGFIIEKDYPAQGTRAA